MTEQRIVDEALGAAGFARRQVAVAQEAADAAVRTKDRASRDFDAAKANVADTKAALKTAEAEAADALSALVDLSGQPLEVVEQAVALDVELHEEAINRRSARALLSQGAAGSDTAAGGGEALDASISVVED